MKRSQSIRLVLLSSVGLLAASCDQPDPLARNDFFENEQQCSQANDASACRQALMDAQREHARTAPAFASREDCETRFGLDNCAETKAQPNPDQIQPGEQQAYQSGGSWFLPAMLGYMMGRSMAMPTTYVAPPPGQPRREDERQATGSSGGGTGSGGGTRFGTRSGQPVYRDVNNTVYSGKETLGQTRLISAPRPSPTIARGGFGRTGSTSVAS